MDSRAKVGTVLSKVGVSPPTYWAVYDFSGACLWISDDPCVGTWSDTAFNFTNYLLTSLLKKTYNAHLFLTVGTPVTIFKKHNGFVAKLI